MSQELNEKCCCTENSGSITQHAKTKDQSHKAEALAINTYLEKQFKKGP